MYLATCLVPAPYSHLFARLPPSLRRRPFATTTPIRHNRIQVDEEKWLRSLRVWWGPDAPPDGVFGTGPSSEGGAIATVGDWLDRVASRREKQNYKKLMHLLSKFERGTGLAQAGAFGIADHSGNPELTLPLGSTLRCVIRFEV